MLFWVREIAGWALVGLGLFLFYVCYVILLQPAPRILESGPLAFIGFIIFRGGIHLLKVAVVKKHCETLSGALASSSLAFAQQQSNPRNDAGYNNASFDSLMKGGEIGPVVLPGKSQESLLVQMIEGRFEKEGKKKIMPPGKRKKLTAQEIGAIKAWIDAGARPSAVAAAPKEIVVPKITPKVSPRNPINALAWSSAAKLLALARYGEVELRSKTNRPLPPRSPLSRSDSAREGGLGGEGHRLELKLIRALSGHRGNVNALVFSADGTQLFAADGQPGLSGEVRQWNVADGNLTRLIEGHKDSIYSIALSPDGKTLATGSYDQKIKLWSVETGKETKTLSGHNGCVFDLAFRPDGKILASASADRTVKLWDVASGERRDTLSQSLKELYTLAFSPDGKRLVAGGADNRIRVWEISEGATETTDPILYSKFAHEGAILNLVFSPDGKRLLSSADDQTIKLWDAQEMKELLVVEKQPDWPPALAFVDDHTAVAGRLDGTIQIYDLTTGKVLASVLGDENLRMERLQEKESKLAGSARSR